MKNTNSMNKRRSFLLRTAASSLNACGTAFVYSYDKSASGVAKIFSAAYRPARMLKGTLVAHKKMRRSKVTFEILKQIELQKQHLDALCLELGKKFVEAEESGSAASFAEARKLLAEIKELESAIRRNRERAADIERRRRSDKQLKKELKVYARQSKKTSTETRGDTADVLQSIQNAITGVLGSVFFASESERDFFKLVAGDLLDADMEIKTLAVGELSKMKPAAAVPVLRAALNFGDKGLSLVIVRGLSEMGDPAVLPMLSDSLDSPFYRMRLEALTGFCKVSGDEEKVRRTLVKGLEDGHPEVRIAAVKLLGWRQAQGPVNSRAKDLSYDIATLRTVNDITRCLSDDIAAVRNAAITALENIGHGSALNALADCLGDPDFDIREKSLKSLQKLSGSHFTFDLGVQGETMTEAIKDLKRKLWKLDRVLPELDGVSLNVRVDEKDAPAAAEMPADQEMPVESGGCGSEAGTSGVGKVSEVEPEGEDVAQGAATGETQVETGQNSIHTEAPAVRMVEKKPVVSHAKAEPTGDIDLSEENLKKLLKPQLLSLCEDLNIECTVTDPKHEIIEKIINR